MINLNVQVRYSLGLFVSKYATFNNLLCPWGLAELCALTRAPMLKRVRKVRSSSVLCLCCADMTKARERERVSERESERESERDATRPRMEK